MKKHYAFIPLRDQDVRDFRKLLIGDLWFRPVFTILMILVLIYLGFTRHVGQLESTPVLFIYASAIAIMVYLFFLESSRLHYIMKLQKRNLLPFIRTSKQEDTFYTEELKDGFIVQIEPVNFMDIDHCREILSEIVSDFKDSSYLISYLRTCFGSEDESLVNKAVIYTEILKEQLDRGNLGILATYDRIMNYKGEETP